MKKMITSSILLLFPILLFGQTINNLDADPGAGYWGHDISENADSTLSFVNESYVADPVAEGSGAMQLEYSAHNIEAWGGYAKIYHMMAGSDDEPGSPLEGSWKLSPVAGALGVGPSPGDYSWWSSDEAVVTDRACLFDDEYVFNADGSFQNVQGSETWLETWQTDVTADGCGAPVAPHDGSNPATWSLDAAAGTVTISGLGAYLGLAKVHNGGEDGAPVDDMITYNYSLSADGNSMDITIQGFNAGVPEATWIFKMVKAGTRSISFNTDPFIEQLRNTTTDAGVYDWSGYDSISFSYNNTISQSLEDRVHLRLNLSDYGDVADPANYTGQGEYYYSFHYILDNEPGWNTITMPLERNDSWDGGGFNLTGWVPFTGGNNELDKHAIGGFHIEFSISGGGDGDYSNGTIVLDDLKLTGSNNVLTNPGFESADGSGWGSAMGDAAGHAEVVTDASMAHGGDNYLSIGVTDNWAVYYSEDSIPAQFGETWRLSGFGKSLSGDGGGAFFKLEAKDAAGTVLGTTGDVAIAVTDEWENHSIEFVMPEGTVQMAAVIVASRWDGVACDFAFDDMFLMSMGVLDVIPPDPVQNIAAVPASYYNLVTWDDNAGEEGETYNVYASTEPITDISSPAVDVVATNVLEGASAAVHYLHNPLVDLNVAYYYAVACKDGSNNVGQPGASDASITNTAKGVPTISLTPPAEFAADGDLQEWIDSGIMPFELGATENSYGAGHVGMGTVDSDDDLYGTFWAAVDDDYFYLAAEIIDDDVNTEGDGGWWTSDVVQLCLGLYDQRGPKHVGRQRGAEPDYKMYFTPAGANSDDGAGVLAEHGDGNYFHEVFNPDYVFEFRILLDSILIDDDVRLVPANGTRTPFEPMIHDNDGGTWEGQLTLSTTNDDNAHSTCEVWSNTWIGDRSTLGIDGEGGLIPYEFALFNNYPNPFNPVTTIKFSIPEVQQVTLKIYNLMGREVVTLIDQELQPGYHTTKWNAGSMASGVYFYRLNSGNKSLKQKMILLK